jgi:hypothetical protein
MPKAKRPYAHYKFPHEIIIECVQLNEHSCSWYNVPVGSYDLRCTNYGWFPTEVLMGVIKGKYEDTNNIGAAIRGNMGTASIAVTDYKKAIDMLKAQGYKVNPAQ